MPDKIVNAEGPDGERRIAAITGAAGGIGACIAQRMSAQGYAVVLLDTDRSGLDAAARECAGPTLTVTADVTRLNSMLGAAEQAVDAFGGAHVLVANAGIGPSGGVEDTSDETWERVLAVNLTGVFNTVKAFAPVLRRSAGHRSVIMTSSVLALRGAGSMLAYSAAKTGVLGVMQSTSQELARSRITVNAIAPGPIHTPMLDAVAGESLLELKDLVPLQRLGTTDDIANAVMFLGSSAASFITGQVIAVDGGLSSRAYWRDTR